MITPPKKRELRFFERQKGQNHDLPTQNQGVTILEAQKSQNHDLTARVSKIQDFRVSKKIEPSFSNLKFENSRFLDVKEIRTII